MKELCEKVLLRRHNRDYGWDQVARWKNSNLDIQYDDGKESIQALIRKSRLYISTYNATTYLESLSWNVPTIIFWNPAHWELNEQAKPYINQLKTVGIFHETPESAAKHLSEIWDDIPQWWNSIEVQQVKDKFCERWTYNGDDVFDKLVTAIKDVSNKG